jgi:phage terminase large subunit GpA-like protein
LNDKFEWLPLEKPIERPQTVGFVLPSWYSPFVSLSEIVAAHIRGQEDPSKKMVFVTQHEAKPYKETVESKTESQLLSHKTKLASAIVPANAIALTAGIDTHKNGFKFTVFAWEEDPNGLSFTVHKIHHGVLATLKDVEMLIFETRYQVENSQGTMGIWRAAIDTGGGALDEESTMTEEVYQWLRGVRPGTIFGVKGASHRQMNRVKLSTIDKSPHSNKPIPGGLELRILDVDQFKYLLHWRLSRKDEESQRIYLDADTGIDFAQEFLAEELIRDRRGHKKWKRIRSANHYLDGSVYALACGDSEWMPSLKMLSTHIKQLRAKSGEPRAGSGERGAGSKEQRKESKEHGRQGFERPDMEKVRENLSDRWNR